MPMNHHLNSRLIQALSLSDTTHIKIKLTTGRRGQVTKITIWLKQDRTILS